MSLSDGVYTAALTPLNKDLSINHGKLSSHCAGLIDQGCDGVVILGTTGEANSFDFEERKAILESTVRSGVKHDQIIVGTGCCSLTETVNLCQHALDLGVNNVLVLPPFYYRQVSDEGLYRYFEELIQRVDDQNLRIFLYHFPKMTGLPFNQSLIEQLVSAFPKIVAGIKDSSGDYNNMLALIKAIPGFKVFSGTEIHLYNLIQQGGNGTISASLNVSAKQAAQVFQNADTPEGLSYQQELTNIRKAIEKNPLIPYLKLMMSRIENDEDWLNIRPPLMPLQLWSEDELEELIKLVS